MLRATLIRAAEHDGLRSQVTSRKPTRAIALRYVAGEQLDDGIAAVRRLAAAGKDATFDYLGEHVTTADAAKEAAGVYRAAIERIAELPPLDGDRRGCGISVKPTQLGLHVSRDLCLELLDDVAGAAGEVAAQVTLDMEDSSVTEATIRLVEDLQAAGHAGVGCAVQSYLRRTRADVERLTRAGASLRLCKGAYAEPDHLAYQRRRDVDANYAACARWLLDHGHYPRLATHDDRLIDHVKTVVAQRGLGADDFEFQMLHGVRTSLQDSLVAEGFRLRVYVPFGDQWYPYLMRRVAERPANLLFFLRSLRDT